MSKIVGRYVKPPTADINVEMIEQGRWVYKNHPWRQLDDNASLPDDQPGADSVIEVCYQ